ENQYLDARATEVRHARYELERQANDFRNQVRAGLDKAGQDHAILERQLAFLTSTMDTLSRSEASNILNARDAILLEQIGLESDRIFIKTLVKALSSLLENHNAN